MKTVSIVLPVYNEVNTIRKVIEGFYGKVVKNHPEIILIVAEDGSIDGTKEKLLEMKSKFQMKLVMGNKKKGYFKAVKDALMSTNTDFTFFCDTDLTHDPKDFWNLFKYTGNYDLIIGVKKDRKDPTYRKFLSRVYNIFIFFLFGVYFSDINSGFKLMSREIVKKIVPEIKHIKHGFSSELVIRSYKAKMRIKAVPVSHFERRFGTPLDFTFKRIPKLIVEQLVGMIKLKIELSKFF